jgi:protein-tyrosine phosphatase
MDTVGILFVCFGNICRSPIAEAVLRHALASHAPAHRYRIGSRGTTAIHAGKPTDPRARAVLLAAGITPGDHQARQIEDADFLSNSWIIALDAPVLRTLQGWTPRDFEGRIELLTRFAPHPNAAGIADPFNAGPGAFTDTLREIEAAVQGLLRVLLQPGPAAAGPRDPSA